MVKRATQDAVVADEPSGLRARILAAASSLMAKHGVAALTTRSVATAAGVQPPALYRLFGVKRGLLHAVAEYDLLAVMADWQETVPDPASDPVSDLAHGWDFSVAFGLANPAVFAIVNELGVQRSSAVIAGLSAMRGQVEKSRVPDGSAYPSCARSSSFTVPVTVRSPPCSRFRWQSAIRRSRQLCAMR